MSYRTSEEWVYKGLDTVRRFEREASLRKKQIYNKCRVRGPAAMLGRASKQCVHCAPLAKGESEGRLQCSEGPANTGLILKLGLNSVCANWVHTTYQGWASVLFK